MFPIQHSHLHPTFPIPNMNLPILRTCRQEWKTGHAICIGEASRENEVHNLFCQRMVGKSMPRLHSLTFKIPKVSPGHLQKNHQSLHPCIKKKQVYIFALQRLNYATQCNAILAKGLTAMVTQQKRRVDTIQLRRKDPCQLAPMCERPKAGCESHCSHKFSVQTQTNISLGRQRIKSKVSPLKVTRFQCTTPNTRSFTGDVNSPHCYNRTGFSF